MPRVKSYWTYKIRVRCGGRHFDRGMVSLEMFIWLHLINPVTVDCIRRSVILGDTQCLFPKKTEDRLFLSVLFSIGTSRAISYAVCISLLYCLFKGSNQLEFATQNCPKM